MLPIPQIQIRQQYAKLGMDSEPGRYDIKQPRPTQEIKTTRPQIEIQSPRGELTINQDKSWAVYGVGNFFQFMSNIYSEAHRIAMDGIARRVQDGDRMAQISNKADPIPEFAARAFEDLDMNYVTEPSSNNVDISYAPQRPEIQYQPGTLDIQVEVNKPDIEYYRGKLDIYLTQKNSVEIIPPEIDMKI